MKRKTTLSILALGAVALGWAHVACTQTNDMQRDLAEVRIALDQLSQGRTQSALMLLENESRRGSLSPEGALILAHLQDRSNQRQQARATLEKLPQPSPLARTFLQQLGSASPAMQPQRTTPPTPPNGAIRTRLEQSDARLNRLEKYMLGLVNVERERAGLSTLRWNDELAAVSRAHSAEMRDKNYFSHQSPVPQLEGPLDRFRAANGTTPRLIAENIYRAWNGSFLTEAAIRDAHKALLESPGHRANIMLEGATQLGIGITTNASGDIWLTQMYSKP